MLSKRTAVNVLVFGGLSFLLIFIGLTKFVLNGGGGQTIQVVFSDAQGLLPRSDVTVRGVPAGAVSDVKLNSDGTTTVGITLDPGVSVTRGSHAAITRRSPIGDLVVDITPVRGPDLPDGGLIPLADTTQPPDPEKTIEVLARVFGAVPRPQLHEVVHELALALQNRGRDLARLSEAGADLPEKILSVRRQLVSLINNGPKVLDVLAANSRTFADDLTLTADLAAILRDQRFNLVSLSQNGARFAQVANELLATEKPNIACMLRSFGHVNEALAKPTPLQNLVEVLDLNHYFFGAVEQAVQQSSTNPYSWFRVFFLPPQQPAANSYSKHRQAPDVYGGDACRSIYGPGVAAPTQSSPPHVLPPSKIHIGH